VPSLHNDIGNACIPPLTDVLGSVKLFLESKGYPVATGYEIGGSRYPPFHILYLNFGPDRWFVLWMAPAGQVTLCVARCSSPDAARPYTRTSSTFHVYLDEPDSFDQLIWFLREHSITAFEPQSGGVR
jgi:hypothetical protein